MGGYDMGLYDSATGKSLEPIKTVEITELQGEYQRVLLAYTKAERGRIVQLRRLFSADDDCGSNIHYFFDEDAGATMIREDERRFGFQPGVLLGAVQEHAPQ